MLSGKIPPLPWHLARPGPWMGALIPLPHLMVLQLLYQRRASGCKGSDGCRGSHLCPAFVLRMRRSGLGTQAWAESWKKRNK